MARPLLPLSLAPLVRAGTVGMLLLIACALPVHAGERLVTPRVDVAVGQPAFVAVARDAAGPARTLPATSDAPAVIRVGPVRFAAGKRVGFAELTARAPGRAAVTIAGSRCRVTVRPGAPPAVRIVAPIHAAAVWGEVTLAAELRPPAGGKIVRVRWLVDGARHHDDTSGAPTSIVPWHGAPGAHTIVALATDDRGRTARSEIRLSVVAGKATLAVEAESLRSAPRDERQGGTPPALPDPDAGGGKVAALYTPAETLDWHVTVPADGWYQLIARARGDRYLTAPALAIQLDTPFAYPATLAPIATTRRLARHAVGTPLRLRRGKRRLIVSFPNDGFDKASGRDRNAYVDRLELRRLERLPDPAPPAVQLLEPADGSRLDGALTVDVAARDNHRVARTELLVDGAVVASVAGPRLRRRLPADALTPGAHTLEARAVDATGNVGHSRSVRVVRLPYRGLSPAVHVLSARDARGPTESDVRAVDGRTVILKPGGTRATVGVTLARGGRYALTLIARRVSETGGAPARVLVSAARAHGVVGARTIPVPTDHYARTAPVEFALGPGAHTLSVELTGRTRALVARLVLRERGVDRSPPVLAVVYPRPGARLAGPAPVVVDVADNDAVARVELLADGRVVGWSGRGGRVALWLPAGSGRRTLAVRAVDVSGNEATGPAFAVHARPAPADALGPGERAVQLLDRLGLGATPADVAELVAAGEAAWLAAQLRAPASADARALRTERVVFSADPLQAFSARAGRLAGLRLTRRPLRERLTLFWDNHFSTWIGKSEPRLEMLEVARFRALATGRFVDLLRASATSPAMLAYLDQERSKRGRINENYARELLELHTLGVDGGYDQRDVTAVARVLSGWNAARGGDRLRFAADDVAHARGATLFGVPFPGRSAERAGERLLALLAAHPSTARHLARKLAVAFVDDRPPAALVERLAAAFTASGGDTSAVLRALVADPAFFDRRHYRAKIADPLELVVRWLRTGVDDLALDADDHAINLLGMTLFGRIAPDGFPERGGRWLSATALLQRWNAASRIARRMDVARLLGPLDQPRDRDALLAYLGPALLGCPLGPRSLRAVRAAFPELRIVGQARTRALLARLLQLPEAQHQ